MRTCRYAGVALLAAVGLALAYASAAASSGGETTTTTTGAPPTAPTTTVAVTTAPTTTAATTTTAPPTTTSAAPTPRATPAAVRDLDHGCLAVAGALLWLPGHALPLVVGPTVHAPWAKRPARTSISYPAGGAVVSAVAAQLSAATCATPRTAAGTAKLQTLSLFNGAVTADSVTLHVDGGTVGGSSVVDGLRVDGAIVATPAPGKKLPLGSWGYLEVLRSLTVKVRNAGARVRAIGLVVHLLQRRDGVPAGTDVQVAVADLAPPPSPSPAATTTTTTTTTTTAAPTPTAPPSHPGVAPTHAARTPRRPAHPQKPKQHANAPTHEPLTVTPPLGQKHFVFPVAGEASYSDTYGGLRTDVSGGWHHGDDIFAALGTPVVAVASGTLNRVGWERLGGWRLWVRDRNGDEFYYAHLSGYTPLALRSKSVRAGEVLGFVGNSGDAYPSTPPHLHFEIHPRSLLRLQYDGAVDPTTYLEQWHRLTSVRAPHPVLPGITTLPSPQVKQEARFIFRELLSDRGLAPKPVRRKQSTTQLTRSRAPHVRHPGPSTNRSQAVAATAGAHPSGFDPLPLALVGLGALALVGAGLLRLRRIRAIESRTSWLDPLA